MTTVPRPARFGFAAQVLAGVAIGIALGFVARAVGPAPGGGANGLAVALDTVGTLFVQLLRAIVPPLVFTAIVASIANLRELGNAAALAWRTLLWFAITAAIAVAIGLALGLLIQPGIGADVPATAAAVPASTGSWLDFLKGLVPASMIGIEAKTKLTDTGATTSLSFNILQILVVAIAVGFAAIRVGEAGQPFLAFNRSLLEIVRRILWWVIRLTPIGTAGLLGTAIASYGWETLAQLGWFAIAVYAGLALVMFGVYPALLAAHRLSPAAFFAGAWPAIQLGFFSRSSVGTMPLTQAVATDNLGVPRDYAAFAIPLASTTKMDGCAAIYPAIAALFVAQFYGLPLGLSDYLLIALVSVVGSAATAGLTGAVVMLTLTLSTLGLPLEGAGLLLAIDPILDMGRTATNVAGQALTSVIVSKRQGILDEARYADHGAKGLPDLLPVDSPAAVR
ncbi:dicarboxylate/amino acid:cation symporter [Sphingomonas sp. 1P06PA]|uniref:dicarboxylate/amino acid:cation symporter n=1 Tax=Sphingomonas sp. 1P06PA TaxID=554121 RepID=UPI0039A4DBE3